MNFKREHEKTHFYKYTTVPTALIILKNRTLRWSNPLIFNDPFDVQAGFHWDIDLAQIPSLMLEKLEELILSKPPPNFVVTPNHSEFISRMRNLVPIHRFNRERFREVYTPVYQEFVRFMESERTRYVKMRDDYIRRLLVLCLATEFDNILMWSHYADFHRGVVLRLKVADLEIDDDPLWLARPVVYTSKSVPFSGSNIIEEFIGIKERTVYNPGDYWKWAYEKFDVWKYEKEWRVVDPADRISPNGYHDYNFKIEKIDGIYFGCRCSPENISQISELILKQNSNVELYKMKKHNYEYQITAEEMN